MRLYCSLAFTGQKEESGNLLRRAFEKEGISEIFTYIRRSEAGKPYIDGDNIFFSVTHSKNVWMCVFSDYEVGIDFQFFTKKEFLKLANRFFSEEEIACLRESKEDTEITFFDIWTRKEAAGKFIGSGIFKNGVSSIDTVEFKNGKYMFRKNLEKQGLVASWMEKEKLRPLYFFIEETASSKNIKLEKFSISLCGLGKEEIEGVFDIGR